MLTLYLFSNHLYLNREYGILGLFPHRRIYVYKDVFYRFSSHAKQMLHREEKKKKKKFNREQD